MKKDAFPKKGVFFHTHDGRGNVLCLRYLSEVLRLYGRQKITEEEIGEGEVDAYPEKIHDGRDERGRERGRVRAHATGNEGQTEADDASGCGADEHAEPHGEDDVEADALGEPGQNPFQHGYAEPEGAGDGHFPPEHAPQIGQAERYVAHGHGAYDQRGGLAAGIAAHVHDGGDERGKHDDAGEYFLLCGNKGAGNDAEYGKEDELTPSVFNHSYTERFWPDRLKDKGE